VQIFENAANYKLCLIDTAIEVLLLAFNNFVEIERAQPHRQLDCLILVIVHDGVIVAFYSGGKKLQKFSPPHDIPETHLDVLEPSQQEVDPQIEEIAEREESLVRCLVFV
jgi:hypothetical protein